MNAFYGENAFVCACMCACMHTFVFVLPDLICLTLFLIYTPSCRCLSVRQRDFWHESWALQATSTASSFVSDLYFDKHTVSLSLISSLQQILRGGMKLLVLTSVMDVSVVVSVVDSLSGLPFSSVNTLSLSPSLSFGSWCK